MFDTSPKDRIISGTMELAATKPWGDISLLDIAQKSGVSLSDLRKEFCAKEDIFSAFIRKVDDEVLKKVGGQAGADESARERLFDVLMTRFEEMMPYRAAVANIAKAWQLGSGLRSFCRLLGTNYWMLNAAGISADGPMGAVRLAGLVPLYAAVFPVWLEDEEAGLPKTMAALDKRLKRGEGWLRSASNMCKAANDLCCRIKGERKKTKKEEPQGAETETSEGPLSGEIIPPGADPLGGSA